MTNIIPECTDEKKYSPTTHPLVECVGKVNLSEKTPEELRNWLFNKSAPHICIIEGKRV